MPTAYPGMDLASRIAAPFAQYATAAQGTTPPPPMTPQPPTGGIAGAAFNSGMFGGMPTQQTAAPTGMPTSGILGALQAQGLFGGMPMMGQQAAVDPNNTYRLSRPTRALTAADTVNFQTRDGVQGFQFVTNKGNEADIRQKEINEKRNLGGAANPTGFVPYVEGAKYRIWNEKGKDRILYEGEGEDALKKAYRYAQNLSATKGKKANWAVEMMDPATGQWRRVADDDPAKKWTSTLGKIVGTALPLAAIPLTGGLSSLGVAGVAGLTSTAGAIGTSAALGGLGAALAGRDPLKGAIMGGAGAAGGRFIGGALQAGGGLGANLGANAANAIGTGIGTTAGGLATGQGLQNSLLGGVTAGGLSYLGGELLKPRTSTPTGADSGGVSTTPGAGPTGTGAVSGTDGGIVVSGFRPTSIVPSVVDFGAKPETRQAIDEAAKQAQNPAAFDDIANQIVVTAANDPNFFTTGVGASIFGGDPKVRQAVEDIAQETDPAKKATKTRSLSDYLRLAGLGVSLLGGLFGSKGKPIGGPRSVPAGIGGGLNPIFGAQLPAANLPGGLGAATALPGSTLGSRGLRTPQDWYRYGYGPEQAFFNNVRRAKRNKSKAYTGYREYAEGGEVGGQYAHGGRSSFAVGGPGDGRDDKIPALLSDGEYVVDAETVAMLGNGSSKAGADALDKLRVNVRKHKGQKLAKGKFSANAKRPEQYLKKGRK
jgi:hypothetical protein